MKHYPPRPTTRNGSTRQWRKTRAEILTRDHGTCQECGQPATHADHATSRLMGGNDTPTNLRALCAPCNLKKGAA